MGSLTNCAAISIPGFAPTLWVDKRYRCGLDGMDENAIAQIPREIYNKINSLQLHEMAPTKIRPSKGALSKHLKGRSLDMEDIDLEEFLVNDIRVLSNRYIRGAGSDIMMRE